MKYKIYYGGNKVKIPGYYLESITSQRHVWPEDDTEISFSVSGDTLSYTISNLSDRTQYLYEQGELGICLIVEESSDKWIKPVWRSERAYTNHTRNHCVNAYRVTSLTGTIDLNTAGNYGWSGGISKSLANIFDKSASYEDPYREDGYEYIALGIGRYYGHRLCGMRPHKVTDFEEITVLNKAG